MCSQSQSAVGLEKLPRRLYQRYAVDSLDLEMSPTDIVDHVDNHKSNVLLTVIPKTVQEPSKLEAPTTHQSEHACISLFNAHRPPQHGLSNTKIVVRVDTCLYAICSHANGANSALAWRVLPSQPRCRHHIAVTFVEHRPGLFPLHIGHFSSLAGRTTNTSTPNASTHC